MKVLIANIDGSLGFAIAERLLRQGHTVYGLTNFPASSWKNANIRVLPNDLCAESTQKALRVVDAVIAPDAPSRGLSRRFRYSDLTAVRVCRALAGSSKTLIVSGSVQIFGDTGPVPLNEFATVPKTRGNAWLRRFENEIYGMGGIVIRPARLVHGRKENLWLPAAMVRVARRFHRARFLGEGDQIVSAVHVDDLAALYCSVLQSHSPDLVIHGVAENLSMRDLAAAVQRGMGFAGNPSSMRLEVARKIIRFTASWSVSQAMKSEIAHRLRWNPRCPSVLEEFERVAMLEAQKRL